LTYEDYAVAQGCRTRSAGNAPELLDLLRKITGSARLYNFNDAAVKYYRVLPELVGRSFAADMMNPVVFNRQLKKFAMQDTVFSAAFEQIGFWDTWDAGKAYRLVAEVFPALMGICSLSCRENPHSRLESFFSTLARQCGGNCVRIMSPLCPSYRYRMDRNGMLWHSSGELLPVAGARFEKAINTLANALVPLTMSNVTVDWNFWSYSGETRNAADLIDIAYFVKEYYAGFPDRLFDTLQQAYKDIGGHLSGARQMYGIRFAQQSFDMQFGRIIHILYEDFVAKFGSNCKKTADEPAVLEWLSGACGTGSLLERFMEQEAIYRKNVRLDFSEPQILAALREMLLYMHLLTYALDHDQIIIDTESTANYMNIAADYFQAGVFFVKKDRNGTSHGMFTQDLRQPYTVQ
jgi:hypothetical protein